MASGRLRNYKKKFDPAMGTAYLVGAQPASSCPSHLAMLRDFLTQTAVSRATFSRKG